MKNAFTKLASPIKLGPVEIKNRFIVSPMVMNCCNEDGTATERFIAYHEEKAKGGWGLIVTEDYAVDPSGRTYQYIPGLWCDEQIPSHRELKMCIRDRDSIYSAKSRFHWILRSVRK